MFPDADTRRHHYVPQFILRQFANENEQIAVFDKRTDRIFKTKIRNVAAEHGFYHDPSDEQSLEDRLAEIDSQAALLFARIRDRREICISPIERGHLALFAAIQSLRVQEKRASFLDMAEKLHEKMRDMGWNPEVMTGYEPPGPDLAKRQTLDMLRDAGRFAPHFWNKTWTLFEAPAEESFLLSDAPVAMNNTLNQNPYRGTIGLRVTGIEIYLPLSPSLCLGFLCPSVRDLVLAAYEKSLNERLGFGRETPDHDALGEMADAVRYGYACNLRHENAVYLNSLQIRSAERFVFARESSQFTLAKEMVTSHPDLRAGPRSEVA